MKKKLEVCEHDWSRETGHTYLPGEIRDVVSLTDFLDAGRELTTDMKMCYTHGHYNGYRHIPENWVLGNKHVWIKVDDTLIQDLLRRDKAERDRYIAHHNFHVVFE